MVKFHFYSCHPREGGDPRQGTDKHWILAYARMTGVSGCFDFYLYILYYVSINNAKNNITHNTEHFLKIL